MSGSKHIKDTSILIIKEDMCFNNLPSLEDMDDIDREIADILKKLDTSLNDYSKET